MQNIESQPTPVHEELRRERVGRGVAVGGSAVEALLGITAVVLSILGLAGVLPVMFASIAIIAAGASLLFEGVAIGASTSVGAEGHERAGAMSGVGAEALAGLGAIALGILSLVRTDPNVLLPVAAIVLGAGVLFSASAPAEAAETSRTGAGRESVLAAAGVHTLVGLGAIVLGILGVLKIAPLTMTLVTSLIIGAGLLLSGAAVGARVVGMFRHGT